VTAVFALKKVYGCFGSAVTNCVPELKFAATMRTRLVTDVFRIHC